MVMDQQTAEALAELRYQLAQLRSGLGVSTPTGAEGAIRNIRTTVHGLPWKTLTMPAGASGTAQYRVAPGGMLAIQLSITWKVPPGTAVLYGIPPGLNPLQDYAQDQGGSTVTVTASGTVQITTSGTTVSMHLLVPVR